MPSLIMGSSIKSGNRPSPRSSFTRALYLTITCVVLVLYTLRPSSPPTIQVLPPHVNHASNETQRHLYSCIFNGSHLHDLQQRYNLGDNIEYGRRHIRFHRQDIERKSITKLDHELFPKGFEQININNPPRTTHCLKPLDVPVPRSPYPRSVDVSDLLFSISTTYDRLTDPETGPMKEWAHWLTDGQGKSNGARLATHKMHSLGIDVKVYAADSSIEMAKRYLSLLPALYNDTSVRQRKFLAMCDDDTFYPSMHSLLDRLSEFDYTTDLYIGTLSEDINNIQRHGSQAFGGAGIFFSLSLAEKVAGLFDECSTQEKIDESDTGWGPQGDILLRKCIYDHTDVTLTMIRELHQLDIQGDPAGFYEAGLAPLSLHHFKGGAWHKAHLWEGAQRFQSSDDFVISNGFSIAYYPKGIDFNLHQMEKTFGAAPDDYGWNLDFMLGPQRNNLLWTDRKAAWELRESQVQGEGMVRQTYIRKLDDPRWTYGKGGSKMFERDGVLELIWIPS
ncbi:glycosyltransferase family 31 protein [Halenospora varia]|nr:glycosyltransferase family 31 protein [Halenospora varia]